MPLPEDPSTPAAEGEGRISKRHCSSPDFTGQGGRREGLLVKAQARTSGRGVLLVWLAVYLLHLVCKGFLWLHKSWGWGRGGVQQSRTNQWLPKQSCHELMGALCTAASGERTWELKCNLLHCVAVALNLSNAVTL